MAGAVELVFGSWHRSCVGVEAAQSGSGASRPLPPHLLDAASLELISPSDGFIHLGTPHDDYRSGRTRGDPPGVEGQQQEAGVTGAGGARLRADRPERTRDLRGAATAREAWDDRGGLWRRYSAWQASET